LLSRVDQADLTLVVVDCADLPPDAERAAAFLQGYLSSVLPPQEQPQSGMTSPASPGLLRNDVWNHSSHFKLNEVDMHATVTLTVKQPQCFAFKHRSNMYCDTRCSLGSYGHGKPEKTLEFKKYYFQAWKSHWKKIKSPKFWKSHVK